MPVGGWQPVLGLLDQIFFIKISLSKLSVYSLHHHKFVRTPAKEEIQSISIGDPSILNICHTSEATIKKHDFMFLPPLERALDVLDINLSSSK
jgi:hypothetical protein